MLRRGSRRRHNSATDISTTATTTASSSSPTPTAAAAATPSSDDIMCTSSTSHSPASILTRTPTVTPNNHSDHTGEVSQVSTTTSTSTSTATESSGTARALFTRSGSDGRREKRRFFRRLRSDDRNSSQNGSLGGSSGGAGRCGGTSVSQPSDSDDDTLGSLPHEPPHMISSDMISSPPPTTSSTRPTTTTTTNNNNNANTPRRVVSPSVPGAVAARGRAFGEIPQWARVPVTRRPSPLDGVPTPRGDHTTVTATSNSTTNTTTTPTATNGTSNNDHTTPLHVRVPRRSISDTTRGGFASLYPNPSTRVIRSTSNGSANGGSLTSSMLGRSAGSSFFGNVGNLFSSFRLSGNQHSLPEAEILDSEKVVYAEVVEPQDNAFGWLACTPALLLYSILWLLLGIMIGRWSVQTPSWDKEL